MRAFFAIAVVTMSVPIVAEAAGEPAAAAKQERRLCRWAEARAASRMKLRRLCMTSRQWQAASDASVDDEMMGLSTRSQGMASPENGVSRGGPR